MEVVIHEVAQTENVRPARVIPDSQMGRPAGIMVRSPHGETTVPEKIMSQSPAYTIILAAGSGKRMLSPELHKVCFPVGGKPAISRALDTYEAAGIEKHVVVVGDKAGQVMDSATAEHSGVVFAYQREQIGTADAARCGAAAIPRLAGSLESGLLVPGDAGERVDVLIVAGDKVVEPAVLRGLFELYYRERCDLAFVTGRREFGPGLCRIVLDSTGAVMGNVEAIDVAQRRALSALVREARGGTPRKAGELRKELEKAVGASKAAVAFSSVWDLLSDDEKAVEPRLLLERIPEEMTRFTFRTADGESISMSPDEVDATPVVNQSIYVISLEMLDYVLEHLGTENAQKERYLSDMITVLAQGERPAGGRFTVRAQHTDNRYGVMAFNNPEELLEIEDHLRQVAERPRGPEEGPAFMPLSAWREAFAQMPERKRDEVLYDHLAELYTDDEAVIGDRTGLYRQVLDYAATILDPKDKVLVVRSPGRVNLLGRHVDHQGGNCNLMTIGYETLMVVHPRDDDEIRLYSVDKERFPDHRFSIGEVVAELPWEDWLQVVDSEAVLDMARTAQGNWAQYVLASAIRLQKKYPDIKLNGADLVVAGDIPLAAGLSSSSSLVVAAAEALIEVNRLDTVPTQLVDLAGEGEWFVGTRGGSADHAAIKLGQKGKVVAVTFFDFAVEGTYDFPDDYVLAVCNSGIKAQKSSGARDQFNHRVACYRIGFQLIRQFFPQYAPLLHHLRDVNTRRLHVPVSAIYKILLRLPEAATRSELRAMTAPGVLEPFFETHAEPSDGRYPVRGVVLFGLAECERSRRYGSLLASGDVARIGQLMRISHDGDRVSRLADNGEMVPWTYPTSNAHLLALIDDLESQEPERVLRAQLENQAGSYQCSIPEIDNMVDIANRTPGVAGAQLAGAGLGGCMMVMVHRDATDGLARSLTEEFYMPSGREPDILWCRPVAGSGAVLRG